MPVRLHDLKRHKAAIYPTDALPRVPNTLRILNTRCLKSESRLGVL